MENIIYNNVEGVFIPAKEFEYIQTTVKTNTLLLNKILSELAKENPNDFDFLINYNRWLRKIFLKKNPKSEITFSYYFFSFFKV